MSEEMSVFKSYLRRLLQDLKDLKEVLKNKEYDKAEKMLTVLSMILKRVSRIIKEWAEFSASLRFRKIIIVNNSVLWNGEDLCRETV